MSVITPPREEGPPPPLPERRISVPEYQRMIQAGILNENSRIELLDGLIVPKMAHNPPHDGTIELLEDAVQPLLAKGWRIRVQSVITTADSEPEPDLAIVSGSARGRTVRHPGPQEIGVLIEVADSTLAFDRNHKGPSYARAGIPVYWIVNLVDSQIEVYTDPTGPDAEPRYRQRRDYGVNESVPLVVAGQVVGQIAVRELLP